MPEGVGGYPKWQGTLSTFPSFPVIAWEEVRRAWNNVWARSAITLSAAYAIVYLGSIWSALGTRSPAAIHTTETFLNFIGVLRWAALGVAAVMAGSALLEDSRRGALELYLSRAVTRADYLGGKILAVLGLTFATLYVPALVYWVVSYGLFDVSPAGWEWVPLKAAGYAGIWALVVGGLGLGLAAVAKSARAATLLLFGGVASIDVILANLLSAITNNDQALLLSPFADLDQQAGWLFGVSPDLTWPYWWGLLALTGFAIVGWGLAVWKHPKLRGVD